MDNWFDEMEQEEKENEEKQYDKHIEDILLDGIKDTYEYKAGYNRAITDCQKVVNQYFIKLLEDNPEWEIDNMDDFALIPNKEICLSIGKLKGEMK